MKKYMQHYIKQYTIYVNLLIVNMGFEEKAEFKIYLLLTLGVDDNFPHCL